VKVRHLPVVVDAIVWDGTIDALAELRALGLGDGDYTFVHGSDELVLRTSDGDRTANLGDAVVKGVVNEFYPVPADVYSRVYRPVDDTEGEFMAVNWLEHFARAGDS
jgi:hypothetical protein